MPKTNCDYSRTVIYKIVCNDLNITDCYVGHTTDFIKRKAKHKHACNKESDKDYNYNVYRTIRENSGWYNWTMVEIEKWPCNDGKEASARERYWYEQLNSSLNSVVPNRSMNERYIDLKESIKILQKEYQIKNKDKLKLLKQQYYQANKDEINIKTGIKQTCACGGKYTTGTKSIHSKTNKHQDYINSLV